MRLSQEDCDKLQLNLEQVPSWGSIVLRTRDKTKYFKNPIEKHTELFVRFATRNIYQRGSALQNSLLPESMVWCGIQEFYQYKGLVEPYSRQEAKGHLIALLEGVYNALKELHNPPHKLAHLDVRLDNICFTHPPTKQMKLIDLDQCQHSYLPVQMDSEYKQSDMYTPAESTWKNFQLDWKCLGLTTEAEKGQRLPLDLTCNIYNGSAQYLTLICILSACVYTCQQCGGSAHESTAVWHWKPHFHRGNKSAGYRYSIFGWLNCSTHLQTFSSAETAMVFYMSLGWCASTEPGWGWACGLW